MTTLYKVKLWDGNLAPGQKWWQMWNNISSVDALYFYAVPRIGQNSYPQFIEVSEVRIEVHEKPDFSKSWRARITLYNPTPPANIPQQDGCAYTLYLVGVAA